MLEETSDVGPPVLVGEGTWIAHAYNVSIYWGPLEPEGKDLLLKTTRHGDCRELGQYALSFAEHRVRDVILISHEFESAKK